MPSDASGRHPTVPPPDATVQGTVALEPPRRFGRYVIVGRVARGGMATVHLARQRSRGGVEKWVALKVVHPHLTDDGAFIQMFLNEARLVARLDHPNICTVFDFGDTDGTYYLAMEYLQGQPLTAVLRHGAHARRPLPVHLGARVVADAARGLHAAHELTAEDGHRAEVVHRDVSPQNLVVLYNGATKVVDFGIARSREHLGEQTAAGVVKGKLAYMAPEQVRGEPIDRRVDVFALGVVLWEATTRRRLFKRDNDASTVNAILHEEIPRPSNVVPDYPEDLEHLVLCALARDPSERFQTADAMARALESFLATCGTPASSANVGDAMRALFAEQVAAQGTALQRAAEAARAFDGGSPEDSYPSWPSGAFRTPTPLRASTPAGGIASSGATPAPAPAPAPIVASFAPPPQARATPAGGSETAPAITLGAAQGRAAGERAGGGGRGRAAAAVVVGAVVVSGVLALGLWARHGGWRAAAGAAGGEAGTVRPVPAHAASGVHGAPPDTQLHGMAIPVNVPAGDQGTATATMGATNDAGSAAVSEADAGSAQPATSAHARRRGRARTGGGDDASAHEHGESRANGALIIE